MSRIDEQQYKPRTRQRIMGTGYIPVQNCTFYASDSANSASAEQTSAKELCDAQITVSEGHPFWSGFKDFKGIKPDIGGDFVTTKWQPFVDKTIYFSSIVDGRGRLWQAQGPVIPSTLDSYGSASEGWGYLTKDTNLGAYAAKFPALSNSDNELIAFGASAIAKTRPDESPASVTQFLVELRRDGIPFRSKLSRDELRRLLRKFNREGASKTTAKESSNFFLENQFGLKPFIGDLRAFVEIQQKGISVLDNLIANSEKLIRRRYSFPDENLTTTKGGRTTGSSFSFRRYRPLLGPRYFSSMENNTNPSYNSFWDVQTTRKTWFSGAYRIHMPKDMEPVSRLKNVADHLRWDYGLDLDFDTLWNLAPWSWLLDWQFNMGDLITNLSHWADDAVVLQYGYIMQDTKTRYIVSPSPNCVFNDMNKDTTPHRQLPAMGVTVHKKRRLRATPYGFGKTYGSLSVNQKAILAAIGITRF